MNIAQLKADIENEVMISRVTIHELVNWAYERRDMEPTKQPLAPSGAVPKSYEFIVQGKSLQWYLKREMDAYLAAAPRQEAQPAVQAVTDKQIQILIEAVGQARNQQLSPTGTLLLVRRALAAPCQQPAANPKQEHSAAYYDTDRNKPVVAHGSNQGVAFVPGDAAPSVGNAALQALDRAGIGQPSMPAPRDPCDGCEGECVVCVHETNPRVLAQAKSRDPQPDNAHIKPKPNNSGHVLWKDGDAWIPAAIRDSNGAVVLGLCKLCGKGECELIEPCTPAATPAVLGVLMGHNDEVFNATPEALDALLPRYAGDTDIGATVMLAPDFGELYMRADVLRLFGNDV